MFVFFFKTLQVAKYIALVITLLLLAYTPEKVGYYFLKLLEKIGGYNYKISKLYLDLIKLIRPKLWIYFIAFIFTGLDCIENFWGRELISRQIWLDFKPIILPSIITFIAFDRFLKLFIDEFCGIKSDINNIYTWFTSLLTKEKSVIGVVDKVHRFVDMYVDKARRKPF